MTRFSARPVLLFVLSATVAGLASCGEGDNSMQKGFEDGFKTQFVEKFGKSCRSAAAGGGAPADKIAEVCKCAADALVKKYSASELMSLSPETATPVMKECAAKSGLPV
ncbi:hypothetical protein FHR22_003975 [Sphingopyxis panaciterrae]|uniref:hypothetical protein n=1 Tax=Sphingopyxis panaciterrae TaxID=363841 RepID=UPI001420AA98|nr:hypothetical protein [Sphingopyxis panaciterrae]NIJ39228.1 hypothetical protein [Sphingopyxis panaciterrae]